MAIPVPEFQSLALFKAEESQACGFYAQADVLIVVVAVAASHGRMGDPEYVAAEISRGGFADGSLALQTLSRRSQGWGIERVIVDTRCVSPQINCICRVKRLRCICRFSSYSPFPID